VYANNLWVAAGNNGVLRTSTDAITWTTRTTGALTINSLAFGNGLWVAATNSARIVKSTDTVTWTSVLVQSFGSTDVASVKYGNNLWAVGQTSGNIRTSAVTAPFNEVPITVATDISGSDVRLRATISDASSVNATVRLVKTLVEE
jgi:hypothetical protein